MLLSAEPRAPDAGIINVLVVGGFPNQLGDWKRRLKSLGLDMKYHHTYKSEGGSTKAIPDDVGLVIIIAHLIQINHAVDVVQEAHERGIPYAKVDRQWGRVAQRLSELGYTKERFESLSSRSQEKKPRRIVVGRIAPKKKEEPTEDPLTVGDLSEEDGIDPETLSEQVVQAIKEVPSSVGFCYHNRPVETCGDCTPVAGTPEEVEEREREESRFLNEREEEIYERMLDEEEAAKLDAHAAEMREAQRGTDPSEYKSFMEMVLDVITLGPATIQELIATIEPTKAGAIRGAVRRLADMNLVVRTARGVYEPAASMSDVPVQAVPLATVPSQPEEEVMVEKTRTPSPAPTFSKTSDDAHRGDLSVREAVKLLGRAMRREGVDTLKIALLPNGKAAILDELDLDE